jgi:hypothetical protein
MQMSMCPGTGGLLRLADPSEWSQITGAWTRVILCEAALQAERGISVPVLREEHKD